MTAISPANKGDAAPRRALCFSIVIFAVVAGLSVDRAAAQSPSSLQPSPQSQTPAKPPEGAPEDSITHHKFHTGGRDVAFTVTAGTLPLNDEHGHRKAGTFYVAYARDGAAPASRPISFVFNGGVQAFSPDCNFLRVAVVRDNYL